MKTSEQTDTAVNGTGHPKPSNVIEAIARVMAELPGIGKDQQASPQQGGYSYRGIEAITAATQKLCGRHGVVLVPRVTERRTVELVVNGKPWTEEQLQVIYTAYGPGGLEDRIDIGPLWGLGRDNSDKGANKALTQAYKYALVQVFQIGDSKGDGDSESAQADAHPTPADPEAWFREHGWKDRAEHDIWHASARADATLIGTPAKEWCEGHGLAFSGPVPKGLADAFDRWMTTKPGTKAEPVQYAEGEEPF